MKDPIIAPNGTDALAVPNGTDARAVPNGTDVSSPSYDELVDTYRSVANTTTDGIVTLSETLVLVETNFKEQLQQFCGDVGLDPAGSTFRKMRKIGSVASRFKSCLDRLPPNWTTLHKLAMLEPDQFDQVVNDDRFKQERTANVIDLILGRCTAKPHKPDITIDLSDLDESDKINAYREIEALKERYEFRLKVSDEITALATTVPEAA